MGLTVSTFSTVLTPSRPAERLAFELRRVEEDGVDDPGRLLNPFERDGGVHVGRIFQDRAGPPCRDRAAVLGTSQASAEGTKNAAPGVGQGGVVTFTSSNGGRV